MGKDKNGKENYVGCDIFAVCWIFIKQYIKKNSNGTTNDITEAETIVSAKNIGINPDSRAEKREAFEFLVNSLLTRKTTMVRRLASRLGKIFATRSGAVRRCGRRFAARGNVGWTT